MIRAYTKFKRKVLNKRSQLSVSIKHLEGPTSSKRVFSNKKKEKKKTAERFYSNVNSITKDIFALEFTVSQTRPKTR